MHVARIFKTAWGWMGVRATPRGVASIILPKSSRRAVESAVASVNPSSAPSKPRAMDQRNAHGVLARSQRQLVQFVDGTRRDFDFPIDLSAGSAFQRRVWLAAQRIPYGRTRSYQWVARRVGTKEHARAVGLALGANPVPLVVPCHRVIARNGSLGGFSGGLQIKRRLLALEGKPPRLRRKVGTPKVAKS